MNDRFNIRYFNKNKKEFEYLKIGAVNFNLFTDWTVYEQGQFCTGLKDKNGKLIYEGDIVKTETQAGKIINYGIIGFDKEKASFLMTANLQSRDYQYSFWYLDSLEVIGNIYENEELLEEE